MLVLLSDRRSAGSNPAAEAPSVPAGPLIERAQHGEAKRGKALTARPEAKVLISATSCWTTLTLTT
jgi:hypothetical protein